MKLNDDGKAVIREITEVPDKALYDGSIRYPSNMITSDRLNEYFPKLTGNTPTEENNYKYFYATFLALLLTGTLNNIYKQEYPMDAKVFAYKWLPVVWDYFSANPAKFFDHGDE